MYLWYQYKCPLNYDIRGNLFRSLIFLGFMYIYEWIYHFMNPIYREYLFYHVSKLQKLWSIKHTHNQTNKKKKIKKQKKTKTHKHINKQTKQKRNIISLVTEQNFCINKTAHVIQSNSSDQTRNTAQLVCISHHNLGK